MKTKICYIISISVFSICMLFGAAQLQKWWTERLSLFQLRQDYDRQQRYMLSTIDAFNFIDKELRELADKLPNAARVRLAILHESADRTYIPILRYDVTNVAVNPGYQPYDLVVDASVSRWANYLEKLVMGKCVYSMASDLAKNGVKLHVPDGKFLTCPIMNDHAQLVGAITVNWDDKQPEDLVMSENYTTETAAAISVKLAEVAVNARINK